MRFAALFQYFVFKGIVEPGFFEAVYSKLCFHLRRVSPEYNLPRGKAPPLPLLILLPFPGTPTMSAIPLG